MFEILSAKKIAVFSFFFGTCLFKKKKVYIFPYSEQQNFFHNFSIIPSERKFYKLSNRIYKKYVQQLQTCLFIEYIGRNAGDMIRVSHTRRKGLQRIESSLTKYDEMVASKRKTIEPACMPPTARAAHFHGQRVFHQIIVWRNLHDGDIDPTSLGWKLEQGKLIPVPTDKDPAPESLLNIIRCGCKSVCGSRCSCRRAGLKCVSSCKECCGISCSNVVVYEDSDEE